MTELWNTTPRTLEECLRSIESLRFYETIYSENAPVEYSIVLTNDLMVDLIRRIMRLEADNGI